MQKIVWIKIVTLLAAIFFVNACSDMLGQFSNKTTRGNGSNDAPDGGDENIGNGRIYYSTNGETGNWIPSSNINTYWIWGLAYGNGRFVAIDNTGQVYTSTNNGTSWNFQEDINGPLSASFKLAFGNNYFMAVSRYGSVFRSTDGTQGNWEYLNSVADSTTINDITFGNGRFVVVGHRSLNGVSSGAVFYSDNNGVDWTESIYVLDRPSWLEAIAYGEHGQFVAVNGSAGQIWRSNNNCDSWNSAGTVNGRLYGITYGNGRFVAVGDCQNPQAYSSLMVWSEDGGMSWHDSRPAPGPGTGYWLHDVAYDINNGRFIAVGYKGQIWYSENGGETWNDASISAEINLLEVTYGNNYIVTAGGANQ